MLNNVVGWQSRSILTGLLQYLAKNMDILVKQFWGDFLSISVFSDFKTKKKKKNYR